MPSFSVGFRSSDAVAILDLTGELDAHTAAELDAAFRACKKDGRHQIVINGAQLKYISSAGLSVFLVFVDDIRALGGDIKIASLSDHVFNVFDLLGFPLLFDVVATVDEAVDLFRLTPA